MATALGCDPQNNSNSPPPTEIVFEKNRKKVPSSFDAFGRYDDKECNYDCKGVTTSDIDGDGDQDLIIVTGSGYFLIENKIPQKTLDAKLTPEKEDKK